MDFRYKPTLYPPKIDTSRLPQPFTVRYGEPAAINVDISGNPPPTVRWFVGKSMILNGGSQYRINNSGDCIHTLTMASVEDEIQKGVFIIANNNMGEDRCKVDIIPYKVHLSRHFVDVPNRQTYSVNDTVRRGKPKGRKKLRILKHNKSLPSLGGSTSSLEIDEFTDPKRTRLKSAEDLLRVRDSAAVPALHDPFPAGLLNQSSDSGFTDARSMRRAKRFSSTDNVFDEVQSPTIPSVTMDFDSASSRLTASMPTTPKIRRSFNFEGVPPHGAADENVDPNQRVDYPMLTDEQLEQHATDEILDSVLYDDYDPHLWELSGVNLSSLCKTLIQDLKPVTEQAEQQEERTLSPSEKLKKKRKKKKSKDRITTTTEVTVTGTILRHDEFGNPIYESPSASLTTDDQTSQYSQDASRPSTTYSSMHSLNSEQDNSMSIQSEPQYTTAAPTEPVKKKKRRKKKVETTTEITDTITTIRVDEYGNVISSSPRQSYKEQDAQADVPFIRELSEEPTRLDYVQETEDLPGDQTTTDTSMISSPPGAELSPGKTKKRRKKRKLKGETTETTEVTETTVLYDQYGRLIVENGTSDSNDNVLHETYRPDSIVSDVQYVEDGSSYFNEPVEYVATVPEGKEIQLVVTPIVKEKKRRKKKRTKEPPTDLTSEQSTTETTETTEYMTTYPKPAEGTDSVQPTVVQEDVSPVIEKKKKKRRKSKSAIGIGRDLTLSREEVSTTETVTTETTATESEAIDNAMDQNRNSLGNQSWKGMEMILGPIPGSEPAPASETEYTTTGREYTTGSEFTTTGTEYTTETEFTTTGTEYTTETGSEYTTTTGPEYTTGTEYTTTTTTDSELYQQQAPVEQEMSPVIVTPEKKTKKRRKKKKGVEETNLDNVTIEQTETYIETNIDTVNSEEILVDNAKVEDNNNMFVTEIQVGQEDVNMLNNNYPPQSPDQPAPEDVIYEPKDAYLHDISIGSANDIDLNSSCDAKSLEINDEASYHSGAASPISPTSDGKYESMSIDSALVNLQEEPVNLEEDYQSRRKSMGDLLFDHSLEVAPKECKSMTDILDDDFEQKNRIRRRTYSQELLLTLTTVRIEEEIITPKKTEVAPPSPPETQPPTGKATGIFTNTTVTREKLTGVVDTHEEVYRAERPPEVVKMAEELTDDDKLRQQLNKVELVIPSVDVDRDWFEMDPTRDAPRASIEEFDDSFSSSSSFKGRSRASTLNEVNDLADVETPEDSGNTPGIKLNISQGKQIEVEEKEVEVLPDENTTGTNEFSETTTKTITSTTITEETVVTIEKTPEVTLDETEKIETFVGTVVIENPPAEQESTIGGVGVFFESKEIEQPVVVDSLLPEPKEEIEPPPRPEEPEEEAELPPPVEETIENTLTEETESTGIFEGSTVIVESETHETAELPGMEETVYPSNDVPEDTELSSERIIQDVVETTENTTVEEVIDTQISEAAQDQLALEKPVPEEISGSDETTEVTTKVLTTITTTTTEHIRDVHLELSSDKSPTISQTTNRAEPTVVKTEKLETLEVLAETGQPDNEENLTEIVDEDILPEVDPDSIVVYEYGEMISYFRRDKVLTGDPKTADIIMYVTDPNDTGEWKPRRAVVRPDRPGVPIMSMTEYSPADCTTLEKVVESKETKFSNVEKAHTLLINDMATTDRQISRELEIVETNVEYGEDGPPAKMDIAIEQMPSHDNEVDISLAVDETGDSKEVREANIPGVININLPRDHGDLRGMELVHEETRVYVTAGGDPDHVIYSTSSTSIPNDSITYSIAGRDEKTLAITSDVDTRISTGEESSTSNAIVPRDDTKDEDQQQAGDELIPVDDSQKQIGNLPPHEEGFGMGNVFVKVVTSKDGKIEGISIVSKEETDDDEQQGAKPFIKHVDVEESSEEYSSGEYTSGSESEDSCAEEHLKADEAVYGKYESPAFQQDNQYSSSTTAQQEEVQAKTVLLSEEEGQGDCRWPGCGPGYSHDELPLASAESDSDNDDNDDDPADDRREGAGSTPRTEGEEISTGIFSSSYVVTHSDISTSHFAPPAEGGSSEGGSTEGPPSGHSLHAAEHLSPVEEYRGYPQNEGFPDPPHFVLDPLPEETESTGDDSDKAEAIPADTKPKEPSSHSESGHSKSSNQGVMTELRQRFREQEDDSTLRSGSHDSTPGGDEGAASRDSTARYHHDDVIVQKAFLEGVLGSVGSKADQSPPKQAK